jgi:Domain of unknown function (DUF1929)
MTRLKHFRLSALIALVTLASLQCSDPPTNGGGVATSIEMVSGNNQSGLAGQTLPAPLVVLVTDDNGDPVGNVTVSWSAQGGGTVSASSVATGTDGRASVQRTLGSTTGPQTTTATATGVEGSVTFTSTVGEPLPDGLAITTNPPLSALDQEVFDPAAQPVVLLRDASGNPVADAAVTASIASGSGTLEGTTTATTDATGIAAFADLGIAGVGEHTLEFSAGTASVTSSPVTVEPLPTTATMGEWGPVVSWDIVPLHMSLLPNGKIFAWGRSDVSDTMGMPRIWDPATKPSPTGLPEIDTGMDMLFCAGHTLLPNGNLMVAGGHHKDAAGIKVTYFFSQDGVPTKGPDMAHGRWYPTLTVLADGNVLSMSGRNQAGTVVAIPELWTGTAWTQLTGAGTLKLPYYPRNFVDPSRTGQVFYAGEQVMSRWFNYGGTGSWTSTGPPHIWPFNRDYGTAVMYDTGKILYAGGGGDPNWPCECPSTQKSPTPTNTAEKIDLTQGSPTWQSAGSMSEPRRHLNSTILPDGQVLITGGTRGGGFVNTDDNLAAKNAEIWNPGTNQWTTLAANQIMRVYHSVSMLLPNGTVLHGASGDAMGEDGVTPVPSERNHEIFSPPYLFKGARPAITSATPTVGYGGTITVATPNAAQITEARWIRLGSVTHAFDMGQRANKLTFTRTPTGLSVDVPMSPNQAPPGYYMLFILNRNGVPSTGSMVRVQ